jgi:hypothetical protein
VTPDAEVDYGVPSAAENLAFSKFAPIGGTLLADAWLAPG